MKQTTRSTLEPVDIARHEASPETRRPFAVRAKASLMKLIADIVSDGRGRGRVVIVWGVESVEKGSEVHNLCCFSGHSLGQHHVEAAQAVRRWSLGRWYAVQQQPGVRGRLTGRNLS